MLGTDVDVDVAGTVVWTRTVVVLRSTIGSVMDSVMATRHAVTTSHAERALTLICWAVVVVIVGPLSPPRIVRGRCVTTEEESRDRAGGLTAKARILM